MHSFRDWLAGQWIWQIAAVLGTVVAVLLQVPALQQLERTLYDHGLRWAPATGDEISLALVEIDARSLGGQREDLQTQLARLIHLLHADGAQGVAVLLPLEHDPGLPAWFTALGSVIEDSALSAADRASVNRMQRLLADGQRDLDRVSLLAQVMRDSRMTYLSFQFGSQLVALPKSPALPDPLLRHVIPTRPGTSVPNTMLSSWAVDPESIRRPVFPAARVATAAMGIGYLDAPADADGVIRALPLVIGYQGHYHAALPLLLASRWLEGSARTLRVEPGRGIYLGSRFIATTPGMRIYLGRMKRSMANWKRVRLADVSPTPAGIFRGRLVLVGLAPELEVRPRPAIEGKLTEPEWLGGLTQRLVSFDFYTRPPWANHGRWAALVGAALLVLLLPLFPAWLGLLLAVGSGIGLLAAFEYLLVFQRWWVALGTPAVLLFLGAGVTGLHGLWHHLQDLAYLADDGEALPWWAEPHRRMARWMRGTYRRTQQQPAGPEPAMVLAGVVDVPVSPPVARPDARGRTRTPHLSDEPPDRIAARQSSRAASKAIDVMARGPKKGAWAGTLESVRTLGRYTVENQLGKGAMGAVYRGVDPRINRVVAIKTLNLQQEFEAEELTQVKERFFHEAEVAGRLNHPHIVTIYDVGEDHGLGFIAMELIDGHDMRRYTRKGHLLPINRIMEMGAQVAEALDFAHRNGVVHRDIKPSNIMLDKAGRQVKVADFGIARIGTSGKTRTGTVLGTPPYMSPEQLSGRPVDGRSDVFSLGVVLFELIGGRRPFDGDTVAALMSRIANEPHPDLMALRGGVPACLRNIVDKALEKDPDKRYPNAGAMRLALLRCIENNYTGTGFGGRGA